MSLPDWWAEVEEEEGVRRPGRRLGSMGGEGLKVLLKWVSGVLQVLEGKKGEEMRKKEERKVG